MIVLLGFVIGSLVKVWPWSDREAIAVSQGVDPSMIELHIASACIWCMAGIVLVTAIELFNRKTK